MKNYDIWSTMYEKCELNCIPRISYFVTRTSSSHAMWWGQALFRSYGCFFAEFLGDLSLVRLSLLDLTTCVGLRYGLYILKLREFSWKRALCNLLWRIAEFRYCLVLSFKKASGFSWNTTLQQLLKSNNEQHILHSVLSSHYVQVMEY